MELVEKAKAFAKKAHDGQTRKATSEPYFVHLEGVANILKSVGSNEELIAAGYLHDSVEDTDVRIEDIREQFGNHVAVIVEGNTENKNLTWEERKQHTIDSIATAHIDIKSLICADKLDNISSMIEAYERDGESIWNHFKRGKEKQLWYYSSVANQLIESTESPPDHFYKLKEKVNYFLHR
ncbi:HD domain-containing protein [Cytobacillus sp. FJAT-54145]|uniref:HD domain-containing protein n=1 Tax=Cytobacillus spartinae TaxID=3299023 RepID=A0ABW6KII1_9BACI